MRAEPPGGGRLWRTLLFLLLVGLAGWSLRGLEVETELQALLGPEVAAGSGLAAAEEGPGNQIILLGVAGGSVEQRARTSRALAEALARDPRFAMVQNSAATAEAIREQLFRYRYLLLPEAAAGLSAAGLRRALEQRISELRGGLSLYDPSLVQRDPTLAGAALAEHLAGPGTPERRHGVWFGDERELAVLVARLAQPVDPSLARGRLPQVLQRQFEAVRVNDQQRLLMGGTPVVAAHSAQLVRSEVSRLTLVGTLVLLALLGLAYRSPRLVLLAAVPLSAGVLAGAAVVQAVFGGIHGVTLAFGVTLLGVALDYPLHLFSHLDGNRAHVRAIWRTLGLSLATTVLGYTALALTEFNGLSQLGLFAMTGLLTSAAVTRFLLPCWVRGVVVPAPRRLPHLRLPRPLALGLVLTLGAVGVAYLALQPHYWEDDLERFNPTPPALRAVDTQLRQALDAPILTHLVLVRGADMQQTLARAEAVGERLRVLREQGRLEDFRSPTRLLPSAATQRARREALPTPEALRARLRQATVGLPFRPAGFEPFLQAVAESRELPPLTPTAIAGTALGQHLELLLRQTEAGWQALLPLRGLGEPAAAREAVAGLEGVRYVHVKLEAEQLLDRLRAETWRRVALGAVAIVLCLWLGLRSLTGALRALLPVSAALAATAAVVLATTPGLTLFHLVSLLVVTGIGIDYALFFQRPEANTTQADRTLHGLLTCAVSTAVTFGLLGTADVPVLEAIGRTVALGVVLSFVCAYLLRGGAQLLAASAED